MRKLFVLGLSHHTAPLALREALAVSPGTLRARLVQAASLSGEALLLSTCNRVELYGTADPDVSLAALRDVLLQGHTQAAACLYEKRALDAVRHLFCVASSLDSLVLGEPQILGQLKQAFAAAAQAGTVGPVLGTVFPRAFSVAKRVRTQTAIGENPASVASVAVQLAEQVFGSLAGQPALVLGAGKMSQLLARHLLSAQAGPLFFVNRTFERAEQLAQKLQGQAYPFAQLETLLAQASVVVSSTGATEPVLKKDLIAKVMRVRKGRWLLLIDIAVPRDIEPQAGDLDNVFLYDLDALQRVVSDGHAQRKNEAAAARELIEHELAATVGRQKQASIAPTIRALRAFAHQVAAQEVTRTLPRLAPLSDKQTQLVCRLGSSIVNKLLHAPLSALRKETEHEAGAPADLAQLVARLWALDPTQLPLETAEDDPPDSGSEPDGHTPQPLDTPSS